MSGRDGAAGPLVDAVPDRVVLYPGAGSSADHPSLVAIADRIGTRDPTRRVDRVDFAYRRAGRRAPERAPKLVREVRDELGSVPVRRLVAGGRSMGGRIVSLVAAGSDGTAGAEPERSERPASLVALVLVAYPLHPPGRPERLRVEHFPGLDVPCLFVSGTKDPFGTPDELVAWTETIPGPVRHHWVDGARHELRGADDEVAEVVADFVHDVLGSAPGDGTLSGAEPRPRRPPG